MRVLLDVVVVLPQDSPKKLVLVVMDRLDDEPIVAREVEERARFTYSRAEASAPDLQI